MEAFQTYSGCGILAHVQLYRVAAGGKGSQTPILALYMSVSGENIHIMMMMSFQITPESLVKSQG